MLAELIDYPPEPFAERRTALNDATDDGGLSADQLAERRSAFDTARDDERAAAARDTRSNRP